MNDPPIRGGDATASAAFAGWRVVFSLAVVQACGVGLLQAYSPLLNPIAREFGMEPGEVGAGMSIFIVTMALVGACIGPAVDRGHVRSVMAAGVAIAGAGLFGFARAESPGQLAAGMAVASVGISLYGPLPTNATIVRWFLRRRGTALAIAAAGPAVGGFGIPLLAAWAVETDGWRGAVQLLAAGAVAIALPAIAFGVIGRPEAAGQAQDGATPTDPPSAPGVADEAAAGSAQAGSAAASAGEWMRERDFWLLSAGIGLVFAVPIGMGLYLVPFLEENGVAPQRAALSVSVGAVFGFIGTLASGALADRFPPKRVLFALLGLFAAGFAALAIWPGFAVALVAAAGMGLGTGGVAPLHPLLVGRRFGSDVVASVMGVQGLIGLPLLASAPLVAGAVRDATGHYEPAFLGAAGVLVLAATCIAWFRLDPPRRP